MVAEPVDLPSPAIVVLDFDGGELAYTPDVPSSPTARTTPMSECAGTWPAFDDPAARDGLVREVQALFVGFDVFVTDTLPACDLPFVRVMVGPSASCGLGVGYSEPGCDRGLGDSIVFAKLGADDGMSPIRRAVAIAHEVGHAFGLAHADDPQDVMAPSIGLGEGKTFRDACNPFASSIGSDVCVLAGHCPLLEPFGQNSAFALASVVGERDDVPTRGPCENQEDADHDGCGCRADGGPPGVATAFVFMLRRPRRRCTRADARP